MAYANWLRDRGIVPSKFGSEVAEIVGAVYKGIYHIPGTALHKRTEWHSDSWIELTVRDSLATYDSSELTQFVVLCHDAAIRLEIKAAAQGYLKLCFSKRDGDGSSIFNRHPSIEKAIECIRLWVKKS